MAVSLNLNKVPYILECDKDQPVEKQTTFYIKPLSAKQSASLQDSMKFSGSGEGASMTNIGSNTLEMVKIGLVGWENFKDEVGNEIKFLKDMDANLDRLAVSYRYELAGKIMELSNLSEPEAKNLE